MNQPRTGLLRRVFGGKEQTRSAPLPGVIPPAYSFSQPVTLSTALSISAVYSAVNILGTYVSQMDLEVQRTGQVIPTPALIAQPNTDQSQNAFIRATVFSLALSGDAFWLVSRSRSTGAVINLTVLNPYAMNVEVKDDGTRVYTYSTSKGQTRYNAKEVSHIMVTEIPGRVRGLGVLEANNAGLRAALELRSYADNWFNASGVPKGGYLKSDQDLDGDQLVEARSRWLAQMNDGLPPAMGAGFDYQTVNMNPAEAMFLEQQNFTVTEIARWFGIPAYLLLAEVGDSMSYSNLSTDARLFVTTTLMAYMMPIQDALTALVPRGQVVKFKTEALLRGDTAERYAAYTTAIDAGFMTVDEVRAAEGWAPLQTKESPQDLEAA